MYKFVDVICVASCFNRNVSEYLTQTEILLEASIGIGLEINADETNCVLIFCHNRRHRLI